MQRLWILFYTVKSCMLTWLQALDASTSAVGTGWPGRLVSARPTLASVPEGAPAVGAAAEEFMAAGPAGLFGVGAPDALEYLSMEELGEGLSGGDLEAAINGMPHLQQQHQQQQQQMHPVHPVLAATTGVATSVKPEPVEGRSTHAAAGMSSVTARLDAAPGMRRSRSALELGAWEKMAAGDLDVADPSGHVRQMLSNLEGGGAFGKLTPEERLQKILRYRAKRQLRNFNRSVKYQCRKSLADTRPRVRGRFARDNEPGSVLPHETKKAQRERGSDAVGASEASMNDVLAASASREGQPVALSMQAEHNFSAKSSLNGKAEPTSSA
eukprot:365747-Chlamydomonas_euryale.AAC.7